MLCDRFVANVKERDSHTIKYSAKSEKQGSFLIIR
jgi:hypothetical protein